MTWLLVAVLAIAAGCSASGGPPDMGTAVIKEWDGRCFGRPGDDGQRVIWLRKVYVCRDNGPPNHWWFVQDPDLNVRGWLP